MLSTMVPKYQPTRKRFLSKHNCYNVLQPFKSGNSVERGKDNNLCKLFPLNYDCHQMRNRHNRFTLDLVNKHFKEGTERARGIKSFLYEFLKLNSILTQQHKCGFNFDVYNKM